MNKQETLLLKLLFQNQLLIINKQDIYIILVESKQYNLNILKHKQD